MGKRIRWTDEMIFEEASKFVTRADFERGHRKAYDAAKHHGIMNKVCAHMKPQVTRWTDEMVFEAAAKFNTRKEFEKGSYGAYQYACSRGVIDTACAHMNPQFVMRTDDMIVTSAAKFKSRNEFKHGDSGAYQAACYRGILDQVCTHMQPQHITWTDELIFAAAVEFKTRKEFEEGNDKAYKAAISRGMLDTVCADMKRGRKGFNPSKPGKFYVVELENNFKEYIGFGISNYCERRIKEHTYNANRLGFSLSVIKTIDFLNGKDAADIERELKKSLPIVNTGIVGFKTEAILFSDYNKLEEIIENYDN